MDSLLIIYFCALLVFIFILICILVPSFRKWFCNVVSNSGYQRLPNGPRSPSIQGCKECIFEKVRAPKGLRFHIMLIGKDLNCHKGILSHLNISPEDEVISVDQSDVIIAFVPIVSRAGTDIAAALQKIPENRPVVFMALHHTFDPHYIAPVSSEAINRSNVFSVDLLFYEDQGLLNCYHNAIALEATKSHLQNIQETDFIVRIGN